MCFFVNSAECFGLYSSYRGITTVSQGVLSACAAQSPNSGPCECPGVRLEDVDNHPLI